MKLLTRSMLLALLVPALLSGLAAAQGGPISPVPPVTVTVSTATPPTGTNFTADVNVNLTGLMGVCATAPMPVVLGSYGPIQLNFDITKLQRVGTPVLCDANFAAPITCNSAAVSNATGIVNCTADNLVISDPVAPSNVPVVCLYRVTFTNIGGTLGSPATLTPVSTGGLTSGAMFTPTQCGPVGFSGSDVPFSPVTPAVLTGFQVE